MTSQPSPASDSVAVAFQTQTPMAPPVFPQADPTPMRDVKTELFDKFHRFDDAATYRQRVDQALDEKTNNFAVRFGVEEAEIAIGLNEQDVGALLQVQAEGKEEKVTWINIWSPGRNKDVVTRIAGQYKFSTRMQETILGWDLARSMVKETLKNDKIRRRSAQRTRPPGENVQSPRARPAFLRSPDPEKGISMRGGAAAAKPAPSRGFHQEDIEMYKLLQSQYNYTTIDHGSNFVCIGANWLHHRPNFKDNSEALEDDHKAYVDLVPPKHWAWYVLTNEGTVISFHETPNYEDPKCKDADVAKWKALELDSMRKNTKDLLHQLSIHGIEAYKTRVSASKGVRSDLLSTTRRGPLPMARTVVAESPLTLDASANLFYYLFEDYSAATSILSRSNSILAELTHEVLHITDRKNKEKDNSYIIKHLYAQSKDLRQLKHLFESYENLIKRIMALGTDTATEDKDLSALAISTDSLPGGSPARGVKLSQKAFDRFDRLSVRMRLLMLDTIDEYLEEKASLSNTYFNLMSQKDSQATSKLNRSASLLAKLSVFFLPISFMTSYFSIQIPDLTNSYTGTTYWVAFAVVTSLSFLSLFFFSRLLMVVSDVVDDYVQRFQKNVLGFFRGRKTRGHGEGEGGGVDDDSEKTVEDEV